MPARRIVAVGEFAMLRGDINASANIRTSADSADLGVFGLCRPSTSIGVRGTRSIISGGPMDEDAP